MYRPNFCAECGERLARRGWRAWIRARFCGDCARRFGGNGLAKPIAVISIVAISAFAVGRYLRPPAPPLVIQRAANSPLSDLPVNLNDSARATNRLNSANPAAPVSNADDPGYICGARTKKGHALSSPRARCRRAMLSTQRPAGDGAFGKVSGEKQMRFTRPDHSATIDGKFGGRTHVDSSYGSRNQLLAFGPPIHARGILGITRSGRSLPLRTDRRVAFHGPTS